MTIYVIKEIFDVHNMCLFNFLIFISASAARVPSLYYYYPIMTTYSY